MRLEPKEEGMRWLLQARQEIFYLQLSLPFGLLHDMASGLPRDDESLLDQNFYQLLTREDRQLRRHRQVLP